MGEVWSARHRELPVDAAVKLVRAGVDRAAFRAEVRAMARLDHPNVVRILDHGELAEGLSPELPAGTPWYAMERATDGALQRGPHPWGTVRSVLLALLDGLAHAHARGLLHRDLKPGNVLATRDHPGARPRILLADFGIAHPLDAEGDATASDSASGTPAYMAPEQLQEEVRAFGPWTDLYALGCVAWTLATGAPPYGRGATGALVVAHLRGALPPLPACDAPEGFAAFLRALLHRRPEQRFQCCADAAAALLALPGGATANQVTPSPTLAELETVLLPTGLAPQVPEASAATGEAPPAAPWCPRWAEPRPPPARHRVVQLAAAQRLFGLRRPSPVAREAERDTLWRLLGGVHATQRAAAALVLGPTGSGRTHLLTWLGERATELGVAHVLRVNPGDDPALAARRWTRATGLAESALRAHLATRLPAAHLPLALGLCAPGAAGGVRFDSPRDRALALARLLVVTSDRPVVVLFDDLHTSADAAAMARELAGAPGPLLVVGSADETILPDAPERALVDGLRAVRLTLNPWSHAASFALLHALLPLEGQVASALVERAAGNPRWLVEVVAAAMRASALIPGSVGFTLRPGADPTVLAADPVWEARLDGVLMELDPAAQRSVEVLGALGPEVQAGRWADTCARLDTTPSALAVERLCDLHLLEVTPDHHLRVLHPRILDALASRARAAGRWAEVQRACAATAPDALTASLHAVRAGEGADHLPALWRGFLHEWSVGSRTRAAAAVEAVGRVLETHAAAPRWGVSYTVMLAMQQLAGARPADGEALVTRALAEAEAIGDPTALVWARRTHLRFLRVVGRVAEGVAAAEACLASSEAAGERTLRAEVLLEWGNLLGRAGRTDAAVETLGRAREAYAALGDLHGVAKAHLGLSAALANGGRDAESIEASAVALTGFEATGSVWGLAMTRSDRANAVGRAGGSRDEMRALYRRSIAEFESIGHPDVVFPRLNLALMDVEAGHPEQARPVLDEVVVAFEGRALQALVRAIRLRCLAGTAEWVLLDAELDEIAPQLERSGITDNGIPPLLATAAEEAARAGGRTPPGARAPGAPPPRRGPRAPAPRGVRRGGHHRSRPAGGCGDRLRSGGGVRVGTPRAPGFAASSVAADFRSLSRLIPGGPSCGCVSRVSGGAPIGRFGRRTLRTRCGSRRPRGGSSTATPPSPG